MMGKVKQFMASPCGLFLYSVVTGVVGIIVLLAFLSMVLSSSLLVVILPGIIAFNAAAGGYAITGKFAGDFPHQTAALVAIAALLTVAGCTVLTVFRPWEPLFDGYRYLVAGAAALVFTFIGAWIGNKSKMLNRSL